MHCGTTASANVVGDVPVDVVVHGRHVQGCASSVHPALQHSRPISRPYRPRHLLSPAEQAQGNISRRLRHLKPVMATYGLQLNPETIMSDYESGKPRCVSLCTYRYNVTYNNDDDDTTTMTVLWPTKCLTKLHIKNLHADILISTFCELLYHIIANSIATIKK